MTDTNNTHHYHEAVEGLDQAGREIVSVKITNRKGKRAVLYKRDYEHFVARYGLHAWILTGPKGYEYVRSYAPKERRYVIVAQAIIDAKGVRYIDGDRCNLRLSNLFKPTRDTRAARERRAREAREYHARLRAQSSNTPTRNYSP